MKASCFRASAFRMCVKCEGDMQDFMCYRLHKCDAVLLTLLTSVCSQMLSEDGGSLQDKHLCGGQLNCMLILSGQYFDRYHHRLLSNTAGALLEMLRIFKSLQKKQGRVLSIEATLS